MDLPTKYQVIQEKQIKALEACANHRKSCETCSYTETCEDMVILNGIALEMMLTQA